MVGLFTLDAARPGGVSHDAADLVQDVLRRVSKSISTLRRDKPGQGLRPWLQSITKNVIADHFRESANERESLGLKAFPGILNKFPSPSDEERASWVRTPERILLLRQILDSIKLDYEEKTWQAFWLTAVEGQMTSDVAEDLGLAPGTVRH
ncbi:MAG: sigma-70 family RNA polymerase sigma factor, partial [Planctomycetaceae bacterium]|nr:sigma-70 family RNA polymerase sigma factor [Planctomycetaceae bacterium]